VIARFARECMVQMQEVVQKLEVKLGPNRAELAIRVGMHSGPVTAGVLRGDYCKISSEFMTTAQINSTVEPAIATATSPRSPPTM
jgi:class 3 adenylate cyclase